MPNTSKPSSSFKGDEVSKPVKKRQKSSKTSAKETGSKSTGRCEPPVVSSAEEMNAEGKHWYELLEKKIGLDINAKEWMKKHPNLAHENKSELLIRLAHELCLAKNTEYDPENESEEQNNKHIRFDTQRIFALFEVANELVDLSDRRNFVEFICQKGNVQLLEMVCKKESKAIAGNLLTFQYKWNGTFAGYSRPTDLLEYVIDNRCSPEIVLCIAKKIYGGVHAFCNGKQYINSAQTKARKNCDYPDSVVEEFLKKAVKLGYKNTVSVMLSGDIYHCIRLMKWKVFKEKPEFLAAYNMIKETVADVISSWVEDKQSCKDDVRRLLDQGIEIDVKEAGREDIAYQLEFLEKKVIDKNRPSKEKLVKELEKLGKKKGEVRLRSSVVGALVSTLFFKYQDEAMKVVKGELFTPKITASIEDKKEKKLNELNEKINSGESINDTVLELIQLLNSASHFANGWFFREVLAKVVNENLDKLKAVCAAICKEPMEELLKGEEVHEDVIDVLQFFGVEKDFLLEKSIPGNSDDALVRNSQGVEETVSNRSEKSISSSSRQSSADHDPQKTTVEGRGGKSIPSAASNLPSSRVAEKNNEGVMQNNCVQGGNPCYSINTGREFYYLNIPNSLIEDRMEESQQGGIISKMRSKTRESLRKKSSNNRLPRISDLEDAHCERYRKAFLYKIFDYSKFIDFRSLREDPNTEKSCLSPNDSSSISLNASSFALNESCERDSYMDGMYDYDDGFDLLKEGNEDQAKNKIRMAASKGFEGGMYAYAMIKFKEIMEGNITNSQEAVNEAVNYMVKSGKSFSPLNSFILGIMQLYNVGGYCEMIQCASQKSWKIHFADVLRSTKNTPFMDSIKRHNLLVYLGATNFDFTDSAEYLCVVGEEKGMKELESMIDHVKYELAKYMVSSNTGLVTAEYLFRRLSDKSFPDAQYSYAVALFSDKFGRKENKNKEEEVHNLLIKAVRRQHQDTKLFLGRLLFKKEYELFHSNSYWNYLDITCDNRDLKQKYLKEKIAIFIAYEYIDTHSLYVTPNQQKAKDILRKHCDNNELKKLEKAIEKGQEHSKSPCQLSNVLGTLKRVSSVFQKGGSDGLYTQELTDILKQLRDELKNSKITIQQSQVLFHTLHQLNNTSLLKGQGFILLSQLCFTLREEVNKQPNCHFKEKILLLIGELGKKCIAAQKRYLHDSSFVDIIEPRARRYSATTTSQSQDRRYLHDFSFADITELKDRRYSDTTISQGFACPQTPSTVIRRVSLTRSTSSPELLPRRVLSSTRINSECNALLETSMEDNVFQATASDIDGSISKLYNGLPFLVHANPDGGHLAVETFVAAMGHCEKGEYDKAQPLFKKVFEERQSILGYEHCSTVMVSHNMAMTLCAQDKFDEAIGILNEMLYKLKNHCHAQTIQGNMKIVLDMQAKKQEEARSIFSDGQSISKRGKSGSKLSNLSTRTEQEQSSGSSKQNVSEVTKSNKSSIGEVLCWDESTSESSQSFLRSRSVVVSLALQVCIALVPLLIWIIYKQKSIQFLLEV